MKPEVTAIASVSFFGASFPLAVVNEWLTLVALVISIVAAAVSLWYRWKKRGDED